MKDIWEDLATQSLARELTADEKTFAANLESIYASNIHDFGEVCAALNKLENVKTYTPASLQAKLAALNSDLDKAYQAHGRGAV